MTKLNSGHSIQTINEAALLHQADVHIIESIITALNAQKRGDDGYVAYCEQLIDRFLHTGKTRRAEKLRTALNSFLRYLETEEIPLRHIDAERMERYEAYLRARRLEANTISFYMRTLRTAYNHAVDDGVAYQAHPFRSVYTSVAKTVKRALPFEDIQRIKAADLSRRPRYAYARDLFLLSFLMRGIPFVDMAYLRKRDLRHGIVTYRRKKTGQLITVRWEPCMQELREHLWSLVPTIRKRASADIDTSAYLLPIILQQNTVEEACIRKQYIYAEHSVNHKLHIIGRELELPVTLTTYVARHSWASIAKSRNIPVSIISEGLGHDNERTTQIYLASLDTNTIDDANRKVWEGL